MNSHSTTKMQIIFKEKGKAEKCDHWNTSLLHFNNISLV